MSIIKPKNKMISFRLSDQEYDELRSVCESQGVRSLSDFARLAIEKLIAGGEVGTETGLQSRIEALNSRVQVLDRAVERLAEIVDLHNQQKELAQ
jgi:hypothetical protein